MKQKAGLFLLWTYVSLLGVCVCEYKWQALAVNETVYQINMAIISQMTVASAEEQS